MDCVVIAPSRMPHQSGNRIKSDRRDCLALARLHRAGELTPMPVPTEEDEALRDLVRGREDATRAVRTAKQKPCSAINRANPVSIQTKSST